MSFKDLTSNFLDELEEERIIREYEEECVNDELLDIRKLNLNESTVKSTNNKFDKCLNISDNEYLENLSILDNESTVSPTTPVKPLYIDTSISQFVLDNLNKVAQRSLKFKELNNFEELDKFREIASSTSTINSSQLNDDLTSGLTKSNHSTSLDQLNSSSNDNLPNGSSKNSNNLLIHNSKHSSNENLIEQNNDSLKNNNKRKKTKSIITFELVSARTVQANELIGSSYLNGCDNNSTSKRFALYTIIIKRAPNCLETQPGVIEKRYSDFLRFFLALRKSFPTLFDQFPFPKKIYSNNFEVDVIAERSIVFQHLLTYCLSIKELRTSFVFYEFILTTEFRKCRRLLRNSNFEEAVIFLENLLFILIKLNQIEKSNYLQLNIFTTYLALSACLNECENYNESAHYAEKAFKMVTFNNDFDKNELIIPFLLLSVQLNSRLNTCCKAQNQKLLELSDNGITYSRKESLIDLFVLKNYFILAP